MRVTVLRWGILAVSALLGFLIAEWVMRRSVVQTAERITRAYSPSD